MARVAGIWIVPGFAMVIAIATAGYIMSGMTGFVGTLEGIVQPTAYFGLSTVMLAAGAFWAMATWRLRPNAYLGGAMTLAIVLVLVMLANVAPGALFELTYADVLMADNARILTICLAVLTLWTGIVTPRCPMNAYTNHAGARLRPGGCGRPVA